MECVGARVCVCSRECVYICASVYLGAVKNTTSLVELLDHVGRGSLRA